MPGQEDAIKNNNSTIAFAVPRWYNIGTKTKEVRTMNRNELINNVINSAKIDFLLALRRRNNERARVLRMTDLLLRLLKAQAA